MQSLQANLLYVLVLTAGYEDGMHWKLAFNIHAADGHNFGYGADAWDDDTDVGSDGEAFIADYKNYDVTLEIANYVAIVRHQNGSCEAVRVWEFLKPGKSLHDYLDPDNTSRLIATYDTYIHSYISPSMVAKDKDPIFAVDDGALTFNWWYSTNGVRIGNSMSHYMEGLPGTNSNEDSYHGLGNEFHASTKQGVGGNMWWHDVGVNQGRCGGNSCAIQGTDHGTSLSDGTMYGQYAIYTSDEAKVFPCVVDLQVSMYKYESELVDAFHRADKGGNGLINFEELIFEIADNDGDGVLSFSEYSAARSQNRFYETYSDSDVLTDFNRIDKNDDLKATIDEISFDIADTNKDGELSIDEFAEARSRSVSVLGAKD